MTVCSFRNKPSSLYCYTCWNIAGLLENKMHWHYVGLQKPVAKFTFFLLWLVFCFVCFFLPWLKMNEKMFFCSTDGFCVNEALQLAVHFSAVLVCYLSVVTWNWGSLGSLCFVWVPAPLPVSHFIKFKIQVANFRGSKWAVKFLQHGWLWMHLALFHFWGTLTGMYYQHFISVATRVTLQADNAVSFKLRSTKTSSTTQEGKQPSQQQK